MKEEFESKFKKNEHTWRSRLDFHKQALSKELLKNKEYEEVIKELSERVAEVERKNKELQSLVYKSNVPAYSTVMTSQKESIMAEQQPKLQRKRSRVVSFSSSNDDDEEDEDDDVEDEADIKLSASQTLMED